MATSRLKTKYNDEIIPSLMETLKFKSIMQVPKIKKISVNQGLGAAVNDKKLIQFSVDELTQITGQKAVATKAKKSISNFKLREGMPIGAKVTLRGNMMYEFLDRLISVALPRVRDFRGLSSKGFDKNGNYRSSGNGNEDVKWMDIGFEDDNSALIGKQKVNDRHKLKYHRYSLYKADFNYTKNMPIPPIMEVFG